MSLILDALNRAREDNDTVPGLSTHHAQGAVPSPRLPLFLGGLLVIAVTAIIWLLYNQPQPVAAVVPLEQAEVAIAASRSPVEPVLPEPPKSSVPTTTQPAGSPAAAERVELPEKQPLSSDTSMAEVAELYAQAERGREETAPANPQRATTDQPEASKPSVAAEPALKQDVRNVDVTRLIQEAESQLEDARLKEHAAPFINKLSQQSKDRIPTVYYQRHAYSGRAGESRVLLNGKSLKVGDSPATGMRVEEILPDSVVLRYEDIQFRLRALNSWVNL